MTSLNTVVLIFKNTNNTQSVIVDSINAFKSTVATGVVFSTVGIASEWVDTVLKNKPKAVQKFKEYSKEHSFMEAYYSVSDDEQSMKVASGGLGLTMDCHLINFKLMGVLNYENLFYSKPNKKPLDYSENIGWMISSAL